MEAKHAARAKYLSRLDHVVDYIHVHLEDDVSIDVLADVANFSTFHWHRVYTAMRGETVATTVKRLRLQHAAERLANTEMPIAEIARKCGYNSVEAFSRAFKSAYSLPPAAFRRQGSHAAFKNAVLADDATGFAVTIEMRTPSTAAAVVHSGSYMKIDHAMGKLMTALIEDGRASAGSPPRMMAQFLDDPTIVTEEKLRSYALSPVTDAAHIPIGLETIQVAGDLHAVLPYQGPYADMRLAYRWLYGVWLPQSGYEPADAPVIEEYLNSPVDTSPTELLTNIALPIVESN